MVEVIERYFISLMKIFGRVNYFSSCQLVDPVTGVPLLTSLAAVTLTEMYDDAHLVLVLELLDLVLPRHQRSLQLLPHLLRVVRLLAHTAHARRVGAQVVLSPLNLTLPFGI